MNVDSQIVAIVFGALYVSFSLFAYHRVLPLLTPAFPTRRSSVLSLHQGTGRATFFHKVGRWPDMEVNQLLVANRPQQFFGKFTYDHDLEVEVGDLLARELERRRLKRLMRTFVVTIERGQIFQYPLRKRPVDTIISAVLATNPDAIIVNGARDDVLRQALDIHLSQK